MTETVDLAALAAADGPKVTLLGPVRIGSDGTGTDFAGFDAVDSVYVEIKAQAVFFSHVAPSLAVLLEGSDDGVSWSTLETFTFTTDGTQTATVSTPNAHLRASWSADGRSDWFVDHLTVAPASLNAPGGGGGSPTLLRALYNHTNAVAADDFPNLSWGSSAHNGDAILDCSDPTNPTVITAGKYAVTVTLTLQGALRTGKHAYCSLSMDPDNFDLSTADSFPLDQTGSSAITQPTKSLAAVCYCPAGSVITFVLAHDDSTSASFIFEAVIEQLA